MSPVTHPTKDEAVIRELLNIRGKALYAKSAEMLFSTLAEDAVLCDLAPPLRLSGPDTRNKTAVEGWFATWKGPIGWENRDVTVAVGGDIAFAYGLGHMTGNKVDGETVDLWVRTTTCLRKERGSWKVAHSHTSVPFYMDGSFRAATDLKPQR